MTDLEFINQNICDCKDYIKKLEIKIIEDKKYPSFVKEHQERIEELKPILKHLETIKAKLEAWESIKPYLVVEKRFVNLYEKDFTTIELKNGCIYENVDKILKALEVNKNE